MTKDVWSQALLERIAKATARPVIRPTMATHTGLAGRGLTGSVLGGERAYLVANVGRGSHVASGRGHSIVTLVQLNEEVGQQSDTRQSERDTHEDDRVRTNSEVLGDQVVHKLQDRKSTRLNSSHVKISYAVFCLKKKIDSQ